VTTFGIKKLMGHWQYRSLFAEIHQRGEDPGIINLVEVETRTLKWEGKTVCNPNDPRLFAKVLDHTVCWKTTNGCEGGRSAIINRDPCLE